MRNINTCAVVLFGKLCKCRVQNFIRIAFVSAAIQGERSMAAYGLDFIHCVFKEHIRIVRLRSVKGVSEPEIIPNQDTVLIACFIEAGMAGHTDPVADHGHVGFLVQANLIIEYACGIALQAIVKTPVAAFAEDACAVAEEGEETAVDRVIEAAYAEAECLLIA